jgi:hypothetical protein
VSALDSVKPHRDAIEVIEELCFFDGSDIRISGSNKWIPSSMVIYPEERRVAVRDFLLISFYADLSAPAKSDDVNDADGITKSRP